MNARDVLLRAAGCGVNLSVDEDRLKVELMNGVAGVPADLLEQLRQHKAEVVALLAEPLPHGACVDCGADTTCILTTHEGESWLCPDCCDRLRYKHDQLVGGGVL